MNELARLSASQAAQRIRAGRLRSEELVYACLERIAEREPVAGAWEYLDPEQALAEARQRDRGPPRGPLHGVPVGLKDIIDTAGMPTGYGSPIYRGHRPRADAACVARLREAGAVILGKTVTTEFAYYHPGKTANPHNPAHTPGGSSSGSAAAVADGQVPCALGTQTSGSIIRPAAFTGIIGYKPSFDAFDLDGVHPFAASLDTLGLLARDFADLAPLRGALARERPARDVLAPAARPPRIGVARTAQWPEGEPAMHAAFERTVQALARAGAAIRDLDLPESFARLFEAQKVVFAAEAVRGLDREWREHGDRLSAELRALLEQGRALVGAPEERAQVLARQCRVQLATLMSDFDVLLTPAAIGEAPRGLQATGDPLFNRIWTFLHAPCVCYPVGRGPQGLPLAVQVVAAPGRDATLIADTWWMQERSGEWPALP